MRRRGLGLGVLLLTGCVEPSLQSAALRPPMEVAVIELSMAEPRSSVSRVSTDAAALGSSISQAERERIAWILVLLERADLAVKNKRLAEPRGDNAAEYYRQVLTLQPGYEEALQGLDKIVDRYLQWSDSAMRQGQQAAALRYLALARQVNPSSAKVERSAAGLKSLRASPLSLKPQHLSPGSVTPANVTPQSTSQARYVRLDARQLKAKSPDLIVALGTLADRIRLENARVTIEAPTDSQGRWIYQQLNNRHEEYRVRANFRLEAQPGVRLLD